MIGIYPNFTIEDIGSEKLNNLHKVLELVSGKAGAKPKSWTMGPVLIPLCQCPLLA